ncbi:MAG: efflux RND transporter permease subunit, partial [bacterium]
MVAIAVPFSLFITLAFQYFLGVSLNILSMMGLMLAVGMLVDNAVVVTESIHRHQLQHEEKQKAIRLGVQEVALAITAGTLTTAIVFLPNIVSSSDEIAIYLKHVSITLCIALGTSLILAQTIIPLLVSKAKPPDPDKRNKIVEVLIRKYSQVLDWSLHHRAVTVLVIILLLFSIAVPISMVKMNMFDEPSDRKLYLRYHINSTYTVEKVESVVDIYEEYLFAHQEEFEIESIYSYYTGDYAMSTILLEKGDKARKSMNDIEKLIRETLPQNPIARPSFEQRSSSGRDESIRVQLIGKSSEELVKLSHQVAWSLSRIPGLKDVRSEAETGKKEVQVRVDRQRVQQVGLSTSQVAQVIAAAMRGIRLQRFRSEYGEVEMKLSFQAEDQQTLEDLKNIPLFTREGTQLQLASLADFDIRPGPVNIYRENRTTAMGVQAFLDGITVSEARNLINQVLSRYQFPPGYTWNYGESFSYEDEAFNSMLMNLLMALALIYFLMAALFESLLYPAAIWTQIIFSVVGVYWFFLMTGTQMTVMGMIGILILIGVVVNNGIVLIDFVNQLRHKGLNRHDAMVQAGRARLRPILMTAGTTVLSLLPLCVVTTQIGGDGPPYFPMARAMVGGLTFSTVITLLVLPTIYVLLDD